MPKATTCISPDADADEEFDFGDLARSVRFAAIDLDVKIEFASIEMKPAREANEASATFAIGKITYAESAADPSWLICLKPTYFYEVAHIDVRSYGAANSRFPHESTLDQWFGESQFESYRRLGEYLMYKLYEEHIPKMPPLAERRVSGHTLEQFFHCGCGRIGRGLRERTRQIGETATQLRQIGALFRDMPRQAFRAELAQARREA